MKGRDNSVEVQTQGTILEKIVEVKKEELRELKKERNSLARELKKDKITLIAEIKKASPSKGIISNDFNPDRQLSQYKKAGAGAISILTDEKFFQGSINILESLSSKTNLPVLRKDFIIDSIQVYQSFFLGADVILLIASILEEDKLKELIRLSYSIGLEALVEVHNKQDLIKALNARAKIIGINNRDLRDFTVDLNNTALIIEELDKQGIRDEHLIVAESGIKTREDIEVLEKWGVNGVLIGETLMRADNSVNKIKELFPHLA
ncbi:MAG: indole-3-glycerol phosphate synthase TrpC [Halanaerobiaceae bacterium]